MYNSLKTRMSETLGLSKDALHVHVGIAVFVVLALLLRRHRFGQPLAWLIVLALAVGNEFMDLRGHGGLSGDLGESFKDILNTMLWPTLALVALRFGSARAMLRQAR